MEWKERKHERKYQEDEKEEVEEREGDETGQQGQDVEQGMEATETRQWKKMGPLWEREKNAKWPKEATRQKAIWWQEKEWEGKETERIPKLEWSNIFLQLPLPAVSFEQNIC